MTNFVSVSLAKQNNSRTHEHRGRSSMSSSKGVRERDVRSLSSGHRGICRRKELSRSGESSFTQCWTQCFRRSRFAVRRVSWQTRVNARSVLVVGWEVLNTASGVPAGT